VRGEQPAGHVAIDGKRLRDSATANSTGVHLLAAFSASLQGVIGQLAVAPDIPCPRENPTNEAALPQALRPSGLTAFFGFSHGRSIAMRSPRPCNC
jgi:hypothetical protein